MMISSSNLCDQSLQAVSISVEAHWGCLLQYRGAVLVSAHVEGSVPLAAAVPSIFNPQFDPGHGRILPLFRLADRSG